jgi:hypothetical protein
VEPFSKVKPVIQDKIKSVEQFRRKQFTLSVLSRLVKFTLFFTPTILYLLFSEIEAASLVEDPLLYLSFLPGVIFIRFFTYQYRYQKYREFFFTRLIIPLLKENLSIGSHKSFEESLYKVYEDEIRNNRPEIKRSGFFETAHKRILRKKRNNEVRYYQENMVRGSVSGTQFKYYSLVLARERMLSGGDGPRVETRSGKVHHRCLFMVISGHNKLLFETAIEKLKEDCRGKIILNVAKDKTYIRISEPWYLGYHKARARIRTKRPLQPRFTKGISSGSEIERVYTDHLKIIEFLNQVSDLSNDKP